MSLPPKETPASGIIRVLLVDDQRMLAEAIKRMLIDEEGVEFYYCQHADKAIEQAEQVKPTVILQDLVMPGVDGLEMVKAFRENLNTQRVPMIVLSSREESAIKSETFALGANDYMVKLPDRLEVIARIRYHSKAYKHFLQRNEAYEALLKSQEVLRRELEEAESYVISLLPEREDTECIKTDWIYEASSELGGDAFGYHWLDDDHLLIYLLDVCGHGVGAALLSISVHNVLDSHSLADTDFKDPASVLTGLDKAFEMKRHNDKYFTLWYGVYNKNTRELKYASAGHPPAILIRGDKTLKLATENVVIGARFGVPYQSDTVSIKPGDALYVFSDGVYEVDQRESSEVWTLEGFIDVISSKNQTSLTKIESVRSEVREVQGKQDFDDDFSLMEVVFK